MRKAIILFFLLLPATCLVMAQQSTRMAITFEDFESWMKTLTPMGYPFTETGRNGEEYLATFLKEMKMVGITLSPLSSFDDYKKFKGVTPYEFKGHRAVLIGQQNFWNLTVELKNLNCCIQVTTVYMEARQADLEKIVVESGALDKKPR
ncbi:MAG: hypothetical protein NTU44_06440 [Bacteroidetes bacterium]|nr:hypothetical protein [Bacteroidota bacterium]